MNDIIHCCFSVAITLFTLMNVLTLYYDKQVRGVSMAFVMFLCPMSGWNIYYLGTLGQDMAVAGAVSLFVINIIWLGQMVYYLILESKHEEF